jgi:hypothetical protein
MFKGLKTINWWLVIIILIVVIIGSAVGQLFVDEEGAIIKDSEGNLSVISIDRKLEFPWEK